MVSRRSFLAILLLSLCLDLTAQSDAFFLRPVGTIFIDPGHGGKDPGAVYQDTYEKDITLSIGLQVEEILRMLFPQIQIVMTREDDSTLSLYSRVLKAHQYEGKNGTSKIFVSIHVNAAGDQSASGYEFWIQKENTKRTFLESVVSEANLIGDVRQRNEELAIELFEANRLLASAIEEVFELTSDPQVRNRGIKQEDFYVLERTAMPSVLIETGFLTNGEDRSRLLDPSKQHSIASAIAAGIATYIEGLYLR